MEEIIKQTIGLFRQGSAVLLGMKIRGFGMGLWNGPGGKPEENEDVEISFRREVSEESGLAVGRIERVAFIEFRFVDKPERILETTVFNVLEFSGEPKDTEEMGRWQWFNEKDIPYADMWSADKEWLPLLLAGKKIRGQVLYDSKETRRIISKNFWEAADFN